MMNDEYAMMNALQGARNVIEYSKFELNPVFRIQFVHPRIAHTTAVRPRAVEMA